MNRLGGPRILGLFRGRRRGFGWSGGVLVGDGKEGGGGDVHEDQRA